MTRQGRSQSSWSTAWQYRTPIDPDYGDPTTTVTLYRDNLGGLVLFVDEGDGVKVVGVPLPEADAEDLAAAIHEHRTTDESSERRASCRGCTCCEAEACEAFLCMDCPCHQSADASGGAS